MENESRPRLNYLQNRSAMAMKGQRKVKSYIVIGCVHVPFYNQSIVKGIIDLMKAYQYDGIVIAGDFLDMAALSEYEKGKVSHTNVTLREEYDSGNELLDIFDELLPEDALRVYLYGNHEDRYWRWRADVNNSKLGDVLNPTDELNLKKRGYIVKDNYKSDYYKLGSLQIMHGEYYNIHTAKKHLDEFRRNVLFFHTHRVQMYREGDFCAWNCGMLANIDAPCFDYAKRGMRMKWANSFAIVHTNGDNHHFVEQINCVGNQFVYNGVKYGE
jgi:predicted phosphodiesterase